MKNPIELFIITIENITGESVEEGSPLCLLFACVMIFFFACFGGQIIRALPLFLSFDFSAVPWLSLFVWPSMIAVFYGLVMLLGKMQKIWIRHKSENN